MPCQVRLFGWAVREWVDGITETWPSVCWSLYVGRCVCVAVMQELDAVPDMHASPPHCRHCVLENM